MSNQEVAEKLGITVGTVKSHTVNICGKLQVNRRTQAIAKAKELNLLD
jgi:ATP/maltotriose-dependent transcriptional regulator MalT